MHSAVGAFGVERLCIMSLNPIMQCGQQHLSQRRLWNAKQDESMEELINDLQMEGDYKERE